MKPVSSFDDFIEKWDSYKYERDLFAFFLFDDRPSHRAVRKFAYDEFEWLDTLARSARIFFFIFLGPEGPRNIPSDSLSSGLRRRLHTVLLERFNDQELRTLCFYLNVNYDDLPAEAREGKARELISRLEREDRIGELIKECVRLSPGITFADLPSVEEFSKYSQVSELRIKNPSMEVARVFGIQLKQLPGIVLFTMAEDGVGVSSGVYFPLDKELFDTDITHVEEVFVDLFTMIQDCRDISKNPQDLLIKLQMSMEDFRKREVERPIVRYLRQAVESLVIFPRNLYVSLEPAFEVRRKPGIYDLDDSF